MCERMKENRPPIMQQFVDALGVQPKPEHNCGAYFHYISSIAYDHATKSASKVLIICRSISHLIRWCRASW